MKKVGSEKPIKAKRVGDLVEDRIGPHRGIDADRQRHRQRQDLRRADHEQRGRHPLQDQFVDVDAAGERKAPVALQHRGQPAQIANENRIVDPEFHPQRRADFGRNVGVGGEFAERVARRQRQQDEQNEADAEQAGEGDDQAPENVFSHRRPAIARSGSTHRKSHLGAHVSRYQFAICQRSLSQPLRWRRQIAGVSAETFGRRSTGWI